MPEILGKTALLRSEKISGTERNEGTVSRSQRKKRKEVGIKMLEDLGKYGIQEREEKWH